MRYVKDTDTLHPPSRHCANNVYRHKVVSGISPKQVSSCSKGASSSKVAINSSAVRVKGSFGSIMEISVVEVEATGEWMDSKVVAEPEATG